MVDTTVILIGKVASCIFTAQDAAFEGHFATIAPFDTRVITIEVIFPGSVRGISLLNNVNVTATFGLTF